MEKVISGLIRPEDCDESVRSWLRFFIYKKAKKILALPFDQRRIEINNEPSEELVKMIKEEVIRINKAGNNERIQ